MKLFSKVHTAIIRMSHGKIAGNMGGSELVVLHTLGAKSNRERTTTLMPIPDGKDYFVAASSGGSDKHPSWYHNLITHPENVVIEIKGEKRKASFSEVPAEQYEEVWQKFVHAFPQFGDYRKKTSRRIPLVRLSPVV